MNPYLLTPHTMSNEEQGGLPQTFNVSKAPELRKKERELEIEEFQQILEIEKIRNEIAHLELDTTIATLKSQMLKDTPYVKEMRKIILSIPNETPTEEKKENPIDITQQQNNPNNDEKGEIPNNKESSKNQKKNNNQGKGSGQQPKS